MEQIGPYRILKEIARGGMGVVYRAQDADGKDVALKLLLTHRASNPKARKRYELEVQALSRLQHPNVVPILAAGKHDRDLWLALEFVDGQSLQERLRAGPLPIWEAIRIAQQLAQALSYVHSCGIVHRDLKPGNVLLRGDQALLTDFGLALDAQSSGPRVTSTGAFLGTPGYWAPEQAQGAREEVGSHTDLYGLGAVLYACLTGRPPVQAKSLQEFLETVRFKRVPFPHQLRPEVMTWLSNLTMHCLDPLPAARPGSADEVARALVVAKGRAGQAEPIRGWGPWLAAAGACGVFGVASLGWWATTAQGGGVEDPVQEHQPAPATPARASTEAKALRVTALTKFRAGRYEEAIADYDRALELDPRNPQALYNRGVNKAKLRRTDAALTDYDRALELDPDYLNALNARGLIKTQLGRYSEALTDYDRLIVLAPNFADSYYNRAVAKEGLGRYSEAVSDYDRAIALTPTNGVFFAGRGLSQTKLRCFDEALEDFDHAVELNPRHARAYLDRGALKATLERYEEAIADYDRAIQLDPSSPRAFSNRGASKANLGRHAEAIPDLDRAIQLDPSNAWSFSARGNSKASLKRYSEALEDFDRALELRLDPTEVDRTRRARAQVLRLLGAAKPQDGQARPGD